MNVYKCVKKERDYNCNYYDHEKKKILNVHLINERKTIPGWK